AGLRLVIGCRLDLDNGRSVLCYPMDRAAYARLTRLLTLGKRRAPKGECHISPDDLAAHGEGQIMIALSERADDDLASWLRRLQGDFGARLYLALTRRFRPDEGARLDALAGLARACDVPTVVTNDI